MLYSLLPDKLTVNGTPANNAVLSAIIKQEPRRLEGILLQVTVPFAVKGSGTASTGHSAAGIIALIKSIRLKVSDVIGSRDAINVRGPALAGFLRNTADRLGNLATSHYVDKDAYKTSYVAGNHRFDILIPIRHPQFGEPAGNALSIPLQSLREDATLEIELATMTDVFAEHATNDVLPTMSGISIKAWSLLRETPSDVAYIPSELSTDVFVPNGTGEKTFEFGTRGWLTGVLVQGYNAQYQVYNQARNWLNSTGTGVDEDPTKLVYLQWGRKTQMTLSEGALTYLSEQATKYTVRAPGEYFLDFIGDHLANAPFSIATALPLSPVALGGDKARITWTNWGHASWRAEITQHRLLPVNDSDLSIFTRLV